MMGAIWRKVKRLHLETVPFGADFHLHHLHEISFFSFFSSIVCDLFIIVGQMKNNVIPFEGNNYAVVSY